MLDVKIKTVLITAQIKEYVFTVNVTVRMDLLVKTVLFLPALQNAPTMVSV